MKLCPDPTFWAPLEITSLLLNLWRITATAHKGGYGLMGRWSSPDQFADTMVDHRREWKLSHHSALHVLWTGKGGPRYNVGWGMYSSFLALNGISRPLGLCGRSWSAVETEGVGSAFCGARVILTWSTGSFQGGRGDAGGRVGHSFPWYGALGSSLALIQE